MNSKEIAHQDGMYWGKDVTNTYFRNAESDFDFQWTTIVLPVIGGLSYDTVVDIAAGHGRNAAQLARSSRQVICVDINEDNTRYMTQRFFDDPRFKILLNDGVSLAGIDDDCVDLVYSFDSMVHFDIRVITAYLDECMRILRSGGHAFIHHSNFSENPGGNFRDNPHWRNFMDTKLFRHIARCAGFSIISTQIISWGGVPELDGLALLQKTAN